MSSYKTVLAVESSCDDTSVSIVDHNGQVLAVSSVNQDLAHEPFGGVVPEVAGRKHTLAILPLIESVFEKTKMDWKQIDALAVTNRPGLVTSLLVGLVTVKTLAMALKKPFIGVNHLEGHLLAGFLRDEDYQPPIDFDFPFVGMVVSGGHSHIYHCKKLGEYKVLGQTVDDAAGEAFDKFAKMIGLGFPGGALVDKSAQKGNPKAFSFPRPTIKENNLDMSFSGLKTAGLRWLEEHKNDDIKKLLPDVCASYTQAIVDVLIDRLDQTVKMTGLKRVVISGGVSANSQLRAAATKWAETKKIQLVIPPLRYCTDNAAMIGIAGLKRLNAGEQHDIHLGPSPHSLADDFIAADKR